MRSPRHRSWPPRSVVLASLTGALAAGILSASPCAAAELKAAKDFLAVVRENFNAWDYQHKGTLSREELEVDMQKPQFKGDSAVALAALKWGMQIGEPKSPEETHWTEGVTLADFDAVEKTLDEHGKVDNAAFNNALAISRRGATSSPRNRERCLLRRGSASRRHSPTWIPTAFQLRRRRDRARAASGGGEPHQIQPGRLV